MRCSRQARQRLPVTTSKQLAYAYCILYLTAPRLWFLVGGLPPTVVNSLPDPSSGRSISLDRCTHPPDFRGMFADFRRVSLVKTSFGTIPEVTGARSV